MVNSPQENQHWFIVQTTIRTTLVIDSEELPKALKIWGTAEVGHFKQGFIRGDLIGTITIDHNRSQEIREYKENLEKAQYYKWQLPSEPKSLKDVFDGFDFKELTGEKPKQLN